MYKQKSAEDNNRGSIHRNIESTKGINTQWMNTPKNTIFKISKIEKYAC